MLNALNQRDKNEIRHVYQHLNPSVDWVMGKYSEKFRLFIILRSENSCFYFSSGITWGDTFEINFYSLYFM